MRLSINDDNTFHVSAKKATDQLLELLHEHHDFNLPRPSLLKREAIAIVEQESPAVPVDICVLPIAKPVLTISAIQRVVCQYFGITHSEMLSPRRDKKVAEPRMVAQYLCRELTKHGYPALGKFFDRDHTSIIHAVRKIDEMIKRGCPIAAQVSDLGQMLTA